MAKILLLGTEKSGISLVRSLLREDRHLVYLLRHVERWREAESAREMDLIVAALRPGDQLFAASGGTAQGCLTPILFVHQGSVFPHATHREDRLVDGISIPFKAEEFLARVDALVRVARIVRLMRAEPGDDVDAAAHRAARDGLFWRLGIQASALLGSRIPPYARPHAPYAGVAARVVGWADRRDAFQPGHAERVAGLCRLIARVIELPEEETATTVRAAMLHDIGKVALPISILRQRGPLAGHQRQLVQSHPDRGAKILQALNTDASTIDAIRYHHEHVDGKGYHMKSRRELPWSPRILAVADAYDAMTSAMVMPALSPDTALQRMRDLRGGQFDPDCVNALYRALKSSTASLAVSSARY